MNKDRLLELGLVVALAATVVYWRKRERTVRESLTVSQAWVAPPAVEGSGGADDASERAARLLDTRAEDLPERVAALAARVDELTNDLERARAGWAGRWWDARTSERLDAGEPFVSVVSLPEGELADAKAVTKAAPSDIEGITIVTAGDGTLAVAVTGGLEGFSAAEIAREVAQAAGGNAGGSDDLATGGGNPKDLPAAANAVADRLRSEPPFGDTDA